MYSRTQNQLKSRIRIRIIPDPQHWLELGASSNSMRTAVYFFISKISIFHMNVMQKIPVQVIDINNPTLNVRFTLCCWV
jgi:hypothetical protein